MKRKNLLMVTLILVLAVIFTACGGGSDNGAQSDSSDGGGTVVTKLGHQAPAGTLYDDLAVAFKNNVEERTDGRIEIEIYNGGSLGGDTELMEAVQVGNVEFNVLTASDMGLFVPEMEVQDLPYLFRNWDEVLKFIQSDVALEFYALSDEVGMKTLAFMPRGFRHTTNNKGPINVPEDMNGMKIRVAESAIYVDTYEAFGANPQAMMWGEVFTALQQGTIDGHENTLVTIRDYNIDEVQTYVSETGHMFGFAAIVVNPGFYEGLSEEDQEIVLQSALDAAYEVGAAQEGEEDKVREELKEKGMVFNEVDKDAFVDSVQPVYDKYFETHDRQWFEKIQEAGRN